MEMLQEMTDDERLALRLRYKRDPLFCQWLPVLGMLARAVRCSSSTRICAPATGLCPSVRWR